MNFLQRTNSFSQPWNLKQHSHCLPLPLMVTVAVLSLLHPHHALPLWTAAGPCCQYHDSSRPWNTLSMSVNASQHQWDSLSGLPRQLARLSWCRSSVLTLEAFSAIMSLLSLSSNRKRRQSPQEERWWPANLRLGRSYHLKIVLSNCSDPLLGDKFGEMSNIMFWLESESVPSHAQVIALALITWQYFGRLVDP